MTIKSLHFVLGAFVFATGNMSGSLYITSNSFFYDVYGIQSLLLKWLNFENDFFCRMAVKMKEKFDKYYSIDKVNIF